MRIERLALRAVPCGGRSLASGLAGKCQTAAACLFLLLAVGVARPEVVTTPIQTFEGHDGQVYDAVISADGNQVLTGGQDHTAKLWDVSNGEVIRTFEGHTGNVFTVAFSPDESMVLTGSFDNTARLWNTETGEHLETFEGHTHDVLTAAFSPSGSRVVTGGHDETARLWNTETGELIRTIPHNTVVYSVVFSPDGEQILTGSARPQLWDASTGGIVRSFITIGPSGLTMSVRFSADGKTLLSGHLPGGSVWLWETETGTSLQTIQGLAAMSTGVSSAEFSPDETAVAIGGFFVPPIIADLDTGELVRTFEGHSGAIRSAVFSADGTRLLTAGTDGTARLWATGLTGPPDIPAEARAQGDLNNDGVVNFSDFVFLLEHWGQEIGGTPIGFPDFVAILNNWGKVL